MTEPTVPHSIGVIGVRDFRNEVYANSEYIARSILSHLSCKHLKVEDIGIVTGGGRGVEDLVVKWATRNGVPTTKIPPNIQHFGPRKAFIVRNNNVVAQCDELILFWDGRADIVVSALSTAAHLNKVTTVFPVV